MATYELIKVGNSVDDGCGVSAGAMFDGSGVIGGVRIHQLAKYFPEDWVKVRTKKVNPPIITDLKNVYVKKFSVYTYIVGYDEGEANGVDMCHCIELHHGTLEQHTIRGMGLGNCIVASNEQKQLLIDCINEDGFIHTEPVGTSVGSPLQLSDFAVDFINRHRFFDE